MTRDSMIKTKIENVINNKYTKEGVKPLSSTLVSKIKEYKEYYEQLPSPRGGKNKLRSVMNVVYSLRKLGLFLMDIDVTRYEDATKDNLVLFVKSMSHHQDKTRSSVMVNVNSFYKWMGLKERIDDKRLVPETTKNKKKPSDLLTQEEIKQMLNASGSDRVRSIIMLSIGEGGLRSGEIASLNLCSVEFDQKGVKLWVEKSKSRERYVRLIKAEPYLRYYINNEYILPKNPENPLFYNIAGKDYKERISSGVPTRLLKRVAKSCGIKKKVFCHLGRAINISQLSKLGMSSEISAKRFGITPRTIQNVYLTIDDKDADEGYLRVAGGLSEEEIKKREKEENILKPKECPRCEKLNGATVLYCNCGMVLDQEEAIRMQDKEDKIGEIMNRLVKTDEFQKLLKDTLQIEKNIS